MRFPARFALAACLPLAVGCHSAYVEATVINHTDKPIPLIEVDYPSASFGTENLAPGAAFHYRFKVLGSGATRLLYTDADHHDHTSGGPALKEGDEGRLQISIERAATNWSLDQRAH
jgi:hypothetical protein